MFPGARHPGHMENVVRRAVRVPRVCQERPGVQQPAAEADGGTGDTPRTGT